MDINSNLLKAINDKMEHHGECIGLSKNFDREKSYFVVNEEEEKNTVEVSIRADYLNSHMFLYTFAKMLEEGKVNITFNENAVEKDLNYLEKLSKNL